jgi:branched-chain amino acid transport system permease protein
VSVPPVQDIASAAVAGISVGGIYALVGMSFSLVYRATRVFSFAQGDLVMLGALAAYSLSVVAQLPPIVSVLVTLAGVGMLGPIIARIAVLPLNRRGRDSSGTTGWLVTTLGVSLILENVAQKYWGSEPLAVPSVVSDTSGLVGGVTVPSASRMLPLAAAVAVALGFWLFQRRTLVGQVFDAASQDPEAAELRGINTRNVVLSAFFVGAAVAGVGGFLAAPTTFASYTLGSNLTIKGFVAIGIGGFTEVSGALAGGVIEGLVESIGGLFVGAGFASSLVLVALTIVILARPSGLFSPAAERAV